MPDITIPIACGAGILSFLSPCVLPLVPVYLATIAGTSVLDSTVPNRKYVVLHTIFFIAGFSIVFTALGASVGLLGYIIPTKPLNTIAGVLLILFGIFLIAAQKVPWLNYEKRLSFDKAKGTGYIRSLTIGAIFSLGWIPCVGPVLGGILALASTSQTVWQGILLLLAYCLGLGIPFLLVSLALGTLSPYLKWLNRHSFITSIISAVLLITIGILILTGTMGGIISL
jgi:cytochrome c-type biogenesis protein